MNYSENHSQNFRIYSIHHDAEDYTPYENIVVSPIQGGSAEAKTRLKMQSDDRSVDDKSVNSISDQAYWYSEFTVNDWIYKNATHQMVGIMHYRRALFLNVEMPLQKTGDFCTDHGLTEKQCLQLSEKYCAVVGTPIVFSGTTIQQQHRACHKLSDEFFATAKTVVADKYPDMLSTFISHFGTKSEPAYFKCQIIARDSFFQEYYQFGFDVLDAIEREWGSSVQAQSDKGFRLYAFMGERLMSLFVKYKMNKGASIKTVPIAFYEKIDEFDRYQSTLENLHTEYHKTSAEPTNSCRYVFFHEKKGSPNDKRVSLNINYITHNGDSLSAIYRNGYFWTYPKNNYTKNPTKVTTIAYINLEGKKCWMQFNGQQMESKVDKGSYSVVDQICYKTWGSDGYYYTNLMTWNEPEVSYSQKELSNQRMFVFRKNEKQPYTSLSPSLYAVSTNPDMLMRISQSTNENTMKVSQWNRFQKYKEKVVSKSQVDIVSGEIEGTEAFSITGNTFSLGNRSSLATISYKNWDGAIEQVSIAQWFSFSAKMP